MIVRTTAGVGALAMVLLAGRAYADDPKFEYGKKEDVKDVKKVEWKASAQGGFILTSGNSHTSTLSAGATASRKAGDNKLSLDFGASYGKSDIKIAVDDDAPGTPGAGKVGADEIYTVEQVTTNAYMLKGRYDRFLTEKNSLFVTARAGADKIAGKSLIAGGQIGYSRLLVKNKNHEMASELGYDYSYESYEAPGVASLSIHSARLFLGYVGTLSDVTALTASAELLTNLSAEDTAPNDQDGDGNAGDDMPGIDAFGDNRFTGKLGITTKLSTDISFRFGFTAKLDSAPAPLPNIQGSAGYETGFQPLAQSLDTVTEAQLIINLL
jgi:hypothetical protein